MRFSPFESDVSEEDSDQTRKNLQAVAALAPASPPWKFAFLSDSHIGYDELLAIVEVVNARPELRLVLHGGDMTNLGLRQEFVWKLDILRRFRVPVLTVIGNHDAISNGKQVYSNMFGPYDYTFVHGGVCFVMYNANTLEFGPSVPNRAWLEAQFDAAPDPSRVVMVSHVPPDEATSALIERRAPLAVLYGHVGRFETNLIGQSPALNVSESHHGYWSVVTVERDTVSFERCQYEVCEPLLVPVP